MAIENELSTAGVPRDEVYRESRKTVEDFRFDRAVVRVFDDMVTRSVPFYGEMQRMIVELARDFAQPGSAVYDFGCSTGTTFLNLHPALDPSLRFVGIDNSREMLDQCRGKLDAHGVDRQVDLRCEDLNEGVVVQGASVATMVLTLQFIRPLQRERLMRNIYDGLCPDGCLLLVEKVLGEESLFNRLFIRHYYEMKRGNGYTETEIAQKREALENVLIPYRIEENRELLIKCGYRHVQEFFRWYNFTGMIAVK